MASDFSRVSNVGDYTPYMFNATQSAALVSSDHTHGSFLGSFVCNAVGTSDIITLSNGASAFAVIKSPPVGTLTYNCKCNNGLFVTISGTAGNYTINAEPMAD